MLKFANQILDAYDDVDQDSLKKLAKQRPNCNMLNAEERAGLHDRDFALSVITKTASKLNKFPIDSHDSTWLSMQYFDSNYHKMPIEATKLAAWHIKKACAKNDLKPTAKVSGFAAMLKTAESNVYYEKDGDVKAINVVAKPDLSKLAEVQKIGESYTAAQYAMPSASHVKMACVYLEKNAEKIPLDLRHKYAAAIQRRSHELGMGAQKGYVSKYATDHYSPMVDAHIMARASLLEGRPDLRGEVEKIGSAKKGFTPSQFAQLLHGFDKQAGLSRYYGAGLTDPFIATFASTPDPYAGMRKVASSNMTVDALQQIANAKYAQIKDYFGAHVADELKRHPTEIFESLPMDAKAIIIGIAEGTH